MFDAIYNRIANVYDHMYGVFLKPGIKTSIEAMNLKPGLKLLEVGIGTGLTLDHYPEGMEIVGIDVSEAMLEHCRKKIEERNLKNIRVMNMSGLDIDFPDNTFDRVFAPSVISVIPEPEKAMAEMLRVCKPDGYVCVVSHFAGEKFHHQVLDKLADPITSRVLGFGMYTPARVVESAPDGLVVKKRPVLEPMNFSTVYVLIKNNPMHSGNGADHPTKKSSRAHKTH